ncbi:MAG: TIGR03032 family protein [Pseudomonadota bacterium]
MTDETAEEGSDVGAAGETGEGVPSKPPRISYAASPGLAGWLSSAKVSLAISSYQSGKFYLLGASPRGGLSIHERFFRQAMGLAVPRDGTILLATLYQIVRFENILRPKERANGIHDACYVPRVLWTTGAVDTHDVGMLPDGRPIFVATTWNCLATTAERHSFAEYWRPSFISDLVAEDRCHLNGLAMDSEGPAYVTACASTDSLDGWRDQRRDGGIVIDVRTHAVVCEGLSMPHSPRLHDGQLYVLDSGSGRLGRVHLDRSSCDAFEPLAFCPGFARGLAFQGDMAIVGLSKPRNGRFEGLAMTDALRDRDQAPWCGLQIIELSTGRVRHWFRIEGAVAELYDVAVVAGRSCPMSVGLANDDIVGLVRPEPRAPMQEPNGLTEL